MSRATLFLLSAVLVAPASVGAQEPITLHVPVEIENLHPDIDQVVVGCAIADQLPPQGEEISPAGMQNFTGFFMMASLEPDRSGAVRETAILQGGSSQDQYLLSQLNYYRCYLILRANGPGPGRPMEGQPSNAEEMRYFAQPGTLTLYAEGPLR